MPWIIASLALVIFAVLAFRLAQSRRALIATMATIAILTAAAAGFYLLETRRDAERDRLTRGLISPDEVGIVDATFAYEYGRWLLKGTLVNHSAHRIVGLTLRVNVQDCPAPGTCKPAGEANASTVGIDVPPRETRSFSLRVNLPDMAVPRAMKWDYEIVELRAGRS